MLEELTYSSFLEKKFWIYMLRWGVPNWQIQKAIILAIWKQSFDITRISGRYCFLNSRPFGLLSSVNNLCFTDILQVHRCNLKILCMPKIELCIKPWITLVILNQIEKVGTVLKSACHEGSKTVINFAFDKELTKIFKLKDRAQFLKCTKFLDHGCSIC